MALPMMACAQLIYTTNSGAITITGFTGSPVNVIVPASTNGYPVVNIGSFAFNGCYSLTNITIPNSITNIGTYAFDNCHSLTNITIPASVTSIGTFAFANCFNLTSFIFPNSITNINSAVFYGCPALTNVVIPNSVISISEGAFSDCGLMNLAIPASVTSVDGESFYNCFKLMSITVAANNPNYSSLNGVLFNKNQTTLVLFPLGQATTNSSYIIPNNVTSIGAGAFEICTSLKNVTIPAGVTNIGYEAFDNCTNLTSVTFQGNAPSFGGYAFGNSYASSGLIPATVYYYYGTSGWGVTYDGLPTVELAWSPQINVSASVPSGGFSFTIIGTNGMSITVEASTNFVSWKPIWTNTMPATSTTFTDAQWSSYPNRFYRVR